MDSRVLQLEDLIVTQALELYELRTEKTKDNDELISAYSSNEELTSEIKTLREEIAYLKRSGDRLCRCDK